MSDSTIGRWNIGIGLALMVLFMLYGFFLIYMRDFAPGREAWIAGANVSPHFESRLAHAHGNRFSLLNVVFGAPLLWLPVRPRRARWISLLALAGLLIPIGSSPRSISVFRQCRSFSERCLSPRRRCFSPSN